MAKSNGHPIELIAGLGVAAVGGWWLWNNRATVGADVANLLTPPATVMPTPVTTATTDTTSTPSASPIVISTGGNTTDEANAVVAALQSSGYLQPATQVGVPENSPNSGGTTIQTPYGTVETSVFEPAPTYYPPQTPQVTTPAASATPNSSAQAQLLNYFHAWQQNYYDLKNVQGSNPPSPSAAAYQANIDNYSNLMSKFIQANPGVDSGLDLSPWR